MKEESNCFGLIIWIQAARGYTHLLRALSGWRDAGTEGGEKERERRGESGAGCEERLTRKRLSGAKKAKETDRRPSIRTEFSKMQRRREEERRTDWLTD